MCRCGLRLSAPPNRCTMTTAPPRGSTTPASRARARRNPRMARIAMAVTARHRSWFHATRSRSGCGKDDHPLPHRHVREVVVAQMGGALSHPPSGAAGTHRPPLTREGDQLVRPAGPAAKPGEAARELPAAEEVAELPLDEPREGLPVTGVRGLREEGLEVIADDRVEHALVRSPRSVRNGRGGHPAGRRRGCADRNSWDRSRVRSPRCQVLPRGAAPGSAVSPTARKANDWLRGATCRRGSRCRAHGARFPCPTRGHGR